MKAIQKVCFCLGFLILLAANANAGRWLTRDPIEFMERDPRPALPGLSEEKTAPSTSLHGWDIKAPKLELSNSYQQQANLYTFVDNNPINEIDPLGLWGVQFGDFNFGYGDPNLAFDSGSWDDLGQGAQATLDGIIPFGDPFMNNGGYDPCDKTLAKSRALGAFSRDIYLSTLGLRGVSNSGLLNKNRYFRMGEGRWGKDMLPRISIGNGPPSWWNHWRL